MVEQLVISVIPSAVVAVITLFGVLASNNTKDKVREAQTDARFESLEKEIRELRADFESLSQHVKEHNNLSIRMSVMEQRADGADARLKQLEQKKGA